MLVKSTTSKRPINQSSSFSPSSSSRFSSQYSRSSLSFGSFRNQHDRLSYPRSPDIPSRPGNHFAAAGLAIGGLNVLKSPDLFLKVFQVTDDKTVTNKVSLNFHLLLPHVISLKNYQRIPFKNLRALSFELEIPVVSAPVV